MSKVPRPASCRRSATNRFRGLCRPLPEPWANRTTPRGRSGTLRFPSRVTPPAAIRTVCSAVVFGDRTWTHREYFEESCRFAALFLERLPEAGPRHVAVLLDNTPDYLFAFGGAALIGGAIVGLNHTRRDEHLLRDVEHTHCGLVITEPRHEDLLAPIADGLPALLSSSRFADGDDPPSAYGESLADALAPHADSTDPGLEPDIDSIWALIFTSGTSDAPKAVICSQRRLLVTGKRMSMIMDLNPDDIGYVCMPLFHSNAVQVGWAPSLVVPCAVGLGRRFSASSCISQT